MISGRYTLIELWNDLENDFNYFIRHNTMKASNEEDQKAYMLAMLTLKELIRIGREAESINFFLHPVKKAKLGLRMKNLWLEKFGVDKQPPLKGKLSATFARNVILRFVENSLKMEQEWWIVYLCKLVGINLAEETRKNKEVVEKLRATLNELDGENIRDVFLLSHQGYFANPTKTEKEVLDYDLDQVENHSL
jgi:hypothetical protein